MHVFAVPATSLEVLDKEGDSPSGDTRLLSSSIDAEMEELSYLPKGEASADLDAETAKLFAQAVPEPGAGYRIVIIPGVLRYIASVGIKKY